MNMWLNAVVIILDLLLLAVIIAIGWVLLKIFSEGTDGR